MPRGLPEEVLGELPEKFPEKPPESFLEGFLKSFLKYFRGIPVLWSLLFEISVKNVIRLGGM